MGTVRRRTMSSVRSSGQEVMKLCMLASAPARASRLTSHVNASPRACANDLFEVKDNFTPQVFSLCRFGRFEPLKKASRF